MSAKNDNRYATEYILPFLVLYLSYLQHIQLYKGQTLILLYSLVFVLRQSSYVSLCKVLMYYVYYQAVSDLSRDQLSRFIYIFNISFVMLRSCPLISGLETDFESTASIPIRPGVELTSIK